MSLLLAILQVFLAATFATAAVGKTFELQRFVGTLRLSGLGPAAARCVALAVPAVELLIAGALIAARGQFLTIAFAACGGALLLFTGWLMSMLLRKLNAPCGCFGHPSAPISWRAFSRNVLLVAWAVAGYFLSQTFSTRLPILSFPLIVLATSLFACAALAVYVRESAPYLVLTRRGATDLAKRQTMSRGDYAGEH